MTPSVSLSWQLPATESICSLVSPGIAEWHAPGGNPLRGRSVRAMSTLLRIITIGASLSSQEKAALTHPAFPCRLEGNSPLRKIFMAKRIVRLADKIIADKINMEVSHDGNPCKAGMPM